MKYVLENCPECGTPLVLLRGHNPKPLTSYYCNGLQCPYDTWNDDQLFENVCDEAEKKNIVPPIRTHVPDGFTLMRFNNLVDVHTGRTVEHLVPNDLIYEQEELIEKFAQAVEDYE